MLETRQRCWPAQTSRALPSLVRTLLSNNTYALMIPFVDADPYLGENWQFYVNQNNLYASTERTVFNLLLTGLSTQFPLGPEFRD